MLRHGLRCKRIRAGVYHLEAIPATEGRRLKTTGNPQPQRDFQNLRRNRRPSQPIHGVNSPIRKPGFLQSLRVRNNPTADGATKPIARKEAPGPTSSKLVHLLRKGPESKANEGKNTKPFPKPQSATQSNLSGLSKNSNQIGPAPGLVDFFQRRLREVQENKKQERSQNEATSSSRGRQQPGVYPRPYSQRSGPNRHGGLYAAMMDARIAQRNVDGPIGNATANDSHASRNAPESAASKKETMSPIRQYVAELQKKNQQKREALRAQGPNNTPVPSWRQSARLSSQRNRVQQQRQQEVMAAPIDMQQARENAPIYIQQARENALAQQMLEQAMEEQDTRNKKSHAPPKAIEVVLPSEEVSVHDLSMIFRKKTTEIISCLEDMGESPEEQDEYKVDVDLAEMVALELDINFTRPKRRAKQISDHEQLMNRRKVSEESEDVTSAEGRSYEDLPPRPPVVCIMGHVDHGKTTLMDALRRRSQGGGKAKKKSKKGKKGGKKAISSNGGDVAGTEAGGITQVISAFQVPLGEQKNAITFLDTPGHAAFSAMRQSGSHAADIIVLVIAADDGVSPQTIEILNFYKSIVKEAAGGISMVVAMNKIDKPGIDVEESKTRIENQLLEHDIVTEGIASDSEYGSPVQFVPISAKTGEGLDDLIEGLALQSEVMDLRADDKTRAEGIVMDSRVEQGLGVVVDAIVRWGSIGKGDVVVSDTSAGKVRILKDVNDKQLQKGLPSQPVRIVGFKATPKAGDPIVCVTSEKLADELVERRLAMRERNKSKDVPSDPNSPFSEVIISGRESMTSAATERKLARYDLNLEDTGPIRIPVVVKAKADGSVAAVRDSLKLLAGESSFDINVDPIAEGVGVLTMGEIEMAKESDAVVFCFDLKNQDKAVVARAESEGVAIHEFDVIYSLLDHAREVFTNYLPLASFETVHGKATVQAIFSINNDKDKVAGLRVLEGHIHKSFADADKGLPVQFRVIRDGELVTAEGDEVVATSLKKFKEDVESVRNGDECGLSLSGAVDFEEGDVIECFSIEMKRVFSR